MRHNKDAETKPVHKEVFAYSCFDHLVYFPHFHEYFNHGLLQGLRIMGNPSMTAFAIGSSDPDINIQALADVMETKGKQSE